MSEEEFAKDIKERVKNDGRISDRFFRDIFGNIDEYDKD